jgi:hypothetical protein
MISRERRSQRPARIAYDWLDPPTYGHTGYVALDSLVNTGLLQKFADVPEKLAQLGFVHHVVHPMRVYSKTALANAISGQGLTKSDLYGDYQGPIVKMAAERMADYARPWTSAGDISGSNVTFAFKDAAMAVLFKLIVSEGNPA